MLLETRRGLPGLDLIVFCPRVSLSGYLDKTGINDLALAGFVASWIKLMVEVVEQRFNQLPFDQRFSEQPDRFGVGNLAFGRQPEEAAEGVSIPDRVFGFIIRNIVPVLPYQNFEHQHHIKALTPRVALAFFFSDLVQGRPKVFPVDPFVQVNQRVSFVEFLVAIVKIKKSRLKQLFVLPQSHLSRKQNYT